MKIFLETEAEAGGLLVKGPALATWKADPITKHKKYTRKWLPALPGACLLPPLYLFQALHRFCCFLPSQLLSTTSPSVLYIRSPLSFLQAPTPTLTSSPQPSLEGAWSQDDSPAPSWILLSNRGSAVFPRPGGPIRVSALNMINPARAVVWNCAWGWV